MTGGKVVDLTVEILKEIRDGLRDGFERTNAELVKLNGRFDHLLEFSGERYRVHEQRIERLEERVFGTGRTGE